MYFRNFCKNNIRTMHFSVTSLITVRWVLNCLPTFNINFRGGPTMKCMGRCRGRLEVKNRFTLLSCKTWCRMVEAVGNIFGRTTFAICTRMDSVVCSPRYTCIRQNFLSLGFLFLSSRGRARLTLLELAPLDLCRLNKSKTYSHP